MFWLLLFFIIIIKYTFDTKWDFFFFLVKYTNEIGPFFILFFGIKYTICPEIGFFFFFWLNILLVHDKIGREGVVVGWNMIKMSLLIIIRSIVQTLHFLKVLQYQMMTSISIALMNCVILEKTSFVTDQDWVNQSRENALVVKQVYKPYCIYVEELGFW